ncbi:hypothetical protein DFP72DRAFT_867626 [Ephemerocybe angulata]|uniref:RING-type domain-containing protein n=1 Tax=Ephemerocybe angulata TaxID=980116 RepID=A0A8H6ME93_9AGAR|nr:hypothetical protein DFP72DRAFT_867626 [Tulosesus angulatus]
MGAGLVCPDNRLNEEKYAPEPPEQHDSPDWLCACSRTRSELEELLAKFQQIYDALVKKEEALADATAKLERCPFCKFACIPVKGVYADLFYHCGNVSGGCGLVSCRACKEHNHWPKSCEENQTPDKGKAKWTVEDARRRNLTRTCRTCGAAFSKEGQCNIMTCPKCEANMCFLCRQGVTLDHFRDNKYAGAHRVLRSQANRCPLYTATSIEELRGSGSPLTPAEPTSPLLAQPKRPREIAQQPPNPDLPLPQRKSSDAPRELRSTKHRVEIAQLPSPDLPAPRREDSDTPRQLRSSKRLAQIEEGKVDAKSPALSIEKKDQSEKAKTLASTAKDETELEGRAENKEGSEGEMTVVVPGPKDNEGHHHISPSVEQLREDLEWAKRELKRARDREYYGKKRLASGKDGWTTERYEDVVKETKRYAAAVLERKTAYLKASQKSKI